MIKTKNKKLPHATSIDLSAETRASVVGLLNQQLANVSDLYSQTKQAHWNVRGPEFYQVHKLFDDLAAPLQEMIDELAERAVTIGGFALGTVRCAANLSELEEFPLEPVPWSTFVNLPADTPRWQTAFARVSTSRRKPETPRPRTCSRNSAGLWTRACTSSKHTCGNSFI
jgi:starvation-inducible DNA-binding protein